MHKKLERVWDELTTTHEKLLLELVWSFSLYLYNEQICRLHVYNDEGCSTHREQYIHWIQSNLNDMRPTKKRLFWNIFPVYVLYLISLKMLHPRKLTIKDLETIYTTDFVIVKRAMIKNLTELFKRKNGFSL